MLLVSQHCAWHRELINSRQRNPRVYNPNDVVFACHAIWSDASKGCVGKLEFFSLDPSGLSILHNIKHCHHPTWRMKKHAADLTPYPAELIPFEPIDGPDTQYSQLHKAIDPHPCKVAGISGFLPPQPFKVSAKFIDISNYTDFWSPTLLKLNNDIKEFPWSNEEERHQYFEDNTPFFPPIMYTGPPPEPPMLPHVPEHSTPSITSLAPLIILSLTNFSSSPTS
jgi:hypothetical protein